MESIVFIVLKKWTNVSGFQQRYVKVTEIKKIINNVFSNKTPEAWFL